MPPARRARTQRDRSHRRADADYFLSWLDRLETAAGAHDGYNTVTEQTLTLLDIRNAQQIFNARR